MGVLFYGVMTSAMASDPLSCKVNTAISLPPLTEYDNVAFNVNNGAGIVKSSVLNMNHPSESIDGLLCSSEYPYTISATNFSGGQGLKAEAIGKCTLRSGPIYLSANQSNVTVVFPQDFDCNA